jgi:hypothetical protein
MDALSSENLTPYKVSLCILIQIYLSNKVSTHKFISLLRWLLEEIQNSSGYQESTKQELLESLEGLPDIGPSVANQLLVQLSKLRDPDSVFTFFLEIQELIKESNDAEDDDTKVAKNSVFGIFFRKVLLLWDTAMFAAQSRLFADIQRFNTEEGYRGEVSQKHLKQIINKTASQMQAEVGRYPFWEMEAKIKQLSALAPLIHTPEASFLSYLNCLHHFEFEGALHYLHQYFDYYGAQQQATLNNLGLTAGRASYVQHFASLNLAALYFGFGHLEQALNSLDETITVAQQNGSRECLLHALCLVAAISAARGTPADTENACHLLRRCVAARGKGNILSKDTQTDSGSEGKDGKKEKESHPAPSVEARSWLALAGVTLERLAPAQHGAVTSVWRALQRAAQLDDMAFTHLSPGGDLTLRARAWGLHGHRELSRLASETMLTLHAKHTSSANAVQALVNLAAIADKHAGPGVSSALLEAAQARFPFHGAGGSSESSLGLRFHAALDKGDLGRARAIAGAWFALGSERGQTGSSQIMFGEAMLALREGRVEEAYASLTALLKWCETCGQHREAIRVLLSLISIFQESESTLASLPLVLKCLALTQALGFDSDHAEVMLALARIHLAMGCGSLGLAVVRQVLPHLLEHCPVWLQCEAHIVQAQCLLSLASAANEETIPAVSAALVHVDAEPTTRPSHGNVSQTLPSVSQADAREHVLSAIELLNAAALLHAKTEHQATGKRLFYLLARAYDYVGNVEARNAAAVHFVKSSEM